MPPFVNRAQIVRVPVGYVIWSGKQGKAVPTVNCKANIKKSGGGVKHYFFPLQLCLRNSLNTRFGAPPQFSKSTTAVPDMLADWVLTAAPGFERGQQDGHDLDTQLPCMTEVW